MSRQHSDYLNKQMVELNRILSIPEVQQLLSNAVNPSKKFNTSDMVQQLALQSAYRSGTEDLIHYIKAHVNHFTQ